MKIPFWMSTRSRLILLILLAAVPAFLVQGYGAWSDLQRDVSARKHDAGQTAARAQGKFETLLASSRAVFTELVRLPEMRNLDNCILMFNDLRLAYERLAPDATNIGLSDAEGNIYCAVNPIRGNINIAKQLHFQRAVKTLDMAVDEYASNGSSLPVLNVAYPVLSFDGKVQTVIFINYELNWIESWQREIALPSDTVLTLINPNGDILRRYRDGSPSASKMNAAQTEWYAQLQSGQAGMEAADMDGVIRYHVLVPLRSGSQTAALLHFGYPVTEIYTQARQALTWRLTLLGAIFIVALGLAWWGSEALFMHPLDSLMRVVEKVQQGDLSARAASIPAVGELTGLAESFDRMAESLQQREAAQQRAQFELRESDTRFRAMYDNAAVGMAMMSLDRKIISINQTAAIMTGYTFEELFGSDPSVLSYPDDVRIGMEEFGEMVAGKLPGFQMEKRFMRKGGKIFWGRVTYSFVPDKDGRPEYLTGIIEDITEQREARQKLAEQESEYRRTLEQRVEERTHELAEANQRLVDEIDQRKRAEEALSLKAAEDAVIAERTRLARDLHDAVTQTLFSASIVAEILPELWQMDAEDAKKSTEELGQLTRGALAEMRTLLLELRPAALTQSRLNELIRQLCEALIGRARLPIKFISEGDRTLPPEVQVAFYRIAQESLNNVFKYARATQVNITLFLMPAGAHLEVCDDGVGFDMSIVKPTSLGMRIMRERAEAIGAELSITSKPGEGVCLNLAWNERPDMKLSVFKS